MKLPEYLKLGDGVAYDRSMINSLRNCPVVLITDDHVRKIHGESYIKWLQDQGIDVQMVSFPAGESSKTRETKHDIEDCLFQMGCSKDTVILGMGGGVVTDLAGFVASTFCRGVRYFAIPTTLLGMVDASLGGKTGVNVPWGKNLIGSFILPEGCYIDPIFLETLLLDEMKNGLFEMVKHGLILDEGYISYLEANHESILMKEKEVLLKAIEWSCGLKYLVIQEDLYERGYRKILNFGHTIGHALEAASGYRLPHGQAVAWGCIVEGRLSYQKKRLSIVDLERMLRLFLRICLEDISVLILEKTEILRAMKFDKKGKKVVLIDKIGAFAYNDTDYCFDLKEEEILEAFEWLKDVMYCDYRSLACRSTSAGRESEANSRFFRISSGSSCV